ncbi:MAG: right-handed parallel beta-helix repeat-containing protein [Victivallales bacterium]|nr:right-handed parallel beta-helix repeat-containing protein [Victivallales bacterium]
MKRITCFFLVMCLSMAVLAKIEPDQAKIADVQSGKIKEAHLVWWGFDENDSTEIIKAAIESPAERMIVDKMPSPWITLPIKLKSNFTLVFEEGAEFLAKKGEFKAKGASLISMSGMENISIIGQGKQGGILRMHKTDYQNPPYEKAEWRHCVQMHSCSNIVLENMSMLESGGDGIYIGARREYEQHYCKNIRISNCICDKNHRQGISVIGAVNLLIENTRLTNTSGTPPQAGIDFEPNRPDEPLINCVMRNCYSEGNVGGGFVSYLPNQDSNIIGENSMTFENCISKNEGGSAFSFCSRYGRSSSRLWQGELNVKNCTFENPGRHSISIAVDMIDDVKADFENCKLIGGGRSEKPYMGGQDSSGASPVHVQYINQDRETPGLKLRMNNLTIEDTRDIPWLSIADDAFCGADNYDIAGSVTRTINGATRKLVVDKPYIQSVFKDRKLRRVIHWSDTGKNYTPAKPEEAVELSNVHFRNGGDFWVYAVKGNPVEFTVTSKAISKRETKAVPIKFAYPSGKSIELEKLETGATVNCRIAEAEETGICKVTAVSSGHAIQMDKSLTAAGLMLPSGKMSHLIYGIKELYFNVADNCSEMCFGFKGEGKGEGIKVTIISPDGNIFWERDNIVEICECDFGEAPAVGLWKISFTKPTHAHLEDFYIRPMGAAPYFTVSKDAVPLPSLAK